jgi:hypothetical protein
MADKNTRRVAALRSVRWRERPVPSGPRRDAGAWALSGRPSESAGPTPAAAAPPGLERERGVADALTVIDALERPAADLLVAPPDSARCAVGGSDCRGSVARPGPLRSLPRSAPRSSAGRSSRDQWPAGAEVGAKVVGFTRHADRCCETFHTMRERVRDIVPRVLTACSFVRNSGPQNRGALVVAGVRQGSGKAVSGGACVGRPLFARDLTDPDL